MTRYTDTSDPVRGPPAEYFVSISSFHLFLEKEFIQDRDGARTSTKRSPRRSNIHLNTNNSNNNTTTARIATVKSARRENGVIPNVNISI